MTRTITGKSPYLNAAKARVSNVKLSPSLLSELTNVSTVELTDMNLEPQADAIAALLPPNVVTLTLTNGLFTAIPPGLGSLKRLRSLYVLHTSLACCIALTDARRCHVSRSQGVQFQLPHGRGRDRQDGQPHDAVRCSHACGRCATCREGRQC